MTEMDIIRHFDRWKHRNNDFAEDCFVQADWGVFGLVGVAAKRPHLS